MKIAIDIMGGDGDLKRRIDGAIEASEKIDAQLVLIGDKDQIQQELMLKNTNHDMQIIHSTESIDGDDSPVKAIKRKKNSSMVMGLVGLRHHEYDAFISAGNTGALLVGSLLKVGRIKGIDRPGICTVYPTTNGMAVLVDAGANADCKPRNLLEFAIMGNIYAHNVLGIDEPRVGLLNIGHEEGKGNTLVKEVYDLLLEYAHISDNFNFIGNIEAREIPNAAADVIVCDGFTGNVVLKLTEGMAKMFSTELRSVFTKSFKTKLGAIAVKDGLDDMKNKMDYREYGGAPLLGVKGLVVKAHGSSDAKAFMNAIIYAYKAVNSNVLADITQSMEMVKNNEDKNLNSAENMSVQSEKHTKEKIENHENVDECIENTKATEDAENTEDIEINLEEHTNTKMVDTATIQEIQENADEKMEDVENKEKNIDETEQSTENEEKE